MLNGLTLHQLICFEAVVSEGSFQAAAEKLRRSQPTVSSSIKNLETQLQLSLLDRSGYRVTLTEAGRSFYEHTRLFLHETQRLRDHAAQLAMGEESELRVVIGDISPLPETLGLLRRFFDGCPGTKLHLHFEAISGPVERLLDGEADLILHHIDKADPRRLKFAAQIAMHDVKLAVKEARRCVKELGAVAVIGTPNPVNGQHLHDEVCGPLWNELEYLNVPIGFHPTGTTSLRDDAGRRYVGHANFHPIAHAIRNPVELMGAIASMTTGGVLERHPKLRCAFLEGTAGWLYWWLWRLDDQWEKFGRGCEHQLSMLPSEYFKRQCYIALDVDEDPAVDVVNKMGAEYFVVSSDYPHSDGAFPDAMNEFFGMPLNSEQRRKILWENCARLYAIKPPSQALTAPQASAAE